MSMHCLLLLAAAHSEQRFRWRLELLAVTCELACRTGKMASWCWRLVLGAAAPEQGAARSGPNRDMDHCT